MNHSSDSNIELDVSRKAMLLLFLKLDLKKFFVKVS
jgi:hypothetical protein